jgi:hypothetical protein
MHLNDIIGRNTAALGAGKTKYESVSAGGALATGKIVFAAAPTAGDTITVGDKTLTFRASADAELDEVTIGDLTTTISSIITKLGTYTNSLVNLATYTKTDTNTALTVTAGIHAARLNGDGFPLASSSENGTVTAMAGGVDGFLSLEKEITFFPDTLAQAQGFTLLEGTEGQAKTIVLGARTNSVNNTVKVRGGGVATLTFDAANEYANLIFLGGKWRSLGATATVA